MQIIFVGIVPITSVFGSSGLVFGISICAADMRPIGWTQASDAIAHRVSEDPTIIDR